MKKKTTETNQQKKLIEAGGGKRHIILHCTVHHAERKQWSQRNFASIAGKSLLCQEKSK